MGNLLDPALLLLPQPLLPQTLTDLFLSPRWTFTLPVLPSLRSFGNLIHVAAAASLRSLTKVLIRMINRVGWGLEKPGVVEQDEPWSLPTQIIPGLCDSMGKDELPVL